MEEVNQLPPGLVPEDTDLSEKSRPELGRGGTVCYLAPLCPNLALICLGSVPMVLLVALLTGTTTETKLAPLLGVPPH